MATIRKNTMLATGLVALLGTAVVLPTCRRSIHAMIDCSGSNWR